VEIALAATGIYPDSATHPNAHGTALSVDLCRQRVRLTEVGAPVASSDGDDGQLGDDDGGADGSGHFLGRLDAETDVALRVADDDDGLETRALSGASLLLHGLDLFVVGG